jgi:hypothetical protein
VRGFQTIERERPLTRGGNQPHSVICRQFVIGEDVMKTRLVLCVVICAMMAGPALAGGPDWEQKNRNACRVGGAWLGENAFGPWMAAMSEITPQKGTVVVDWVGGTGEFFGICQDAVDITTSVGVWEKTGPRSFSYTGISYSLDVDENIVCVWKTSGWGELDPGCRTGWLNGTVEFFAPGSDPFEDHPYTVLPPGDDSPFVVMTVDPPAE